MQKVISTNMNENRNNRENQISELEKILELKKQFLELKKMTLRSIMTQHLKYTGLSIETGKKDMRESSIGARFICCDSKPSLEQFGAHAVVIYKLDEIGGFGIFRIDDSCLDQVVEMFEVVNSPQESPQESPETMLIENLNEMIETTVEKRIQEYEKRIQKSE